MSQELPEFQATYHLTTVPVDCYDPSHTNMSGGLVIQSEG